MRHVAADVGGAFTDLALLDAELASRYGQEEFFALADACLSYTEDYVGRALAAVEPGRRTAKILMEDGVASDEPMRLRVCVAADGERLVVDFDGTSEQRENGLNCPYSSTLSMVHYAVKCVLTPGARRPTASRWRQTRTPPCSASPPPRVRSIRSAPGSACR